MNYTYATSSNTATNGVSLGEAGQDVLVKKIIIGTPVANGNIVLYNSAIAVGSASSNVAFKYTLPATITNSSGTFEYERVIDLTGVGCAGLPLDGGNLQIDQTMNVTVLWEPLDAVN